MLLSKETILEMIQDVPPLIEDILDLDVQIQENGIDLTLSTVSDLYGRGTIDFNDYNRFIPHRSELSPEYDEGLDMFCYGLSPGTYLWETREKINLPKGIIAEIIPRKSVMVSGVYIEAGLLIGHRGNIQILAYVTSDYGITLSTDARICQAIFYKNCDKHYDEQKV